MNPKEARLLYKSSLKILKGNQHKNGGWYASPPGTRYPYVYARDHSVDILGAISGGLFKQARKGLEFMLEHQKPNGEFAQRYDTDGNDRSYKELQIDGNGLVLFALGDYCEKSGDLSIAGEIRKSTLSTPSTAYMNTRPTSTGLRSMPTRHATGA